MIAYASLCMLCLKVLTYVHACRECTPLSKTAHCPTHKERHVCRVVFCIVLQFFSHTHVTYNAYCTYTMIQQMIQKVATHWLVQVLEVQRL